MFFLRVVRLLKPVHINDAHVTQMLYFCSNFGTTNPLEGLLNCPSEELVLSEMWPPTLKQCGLYHICINQELLHFRFLTYYFFFRMWRRNVSQGWLNCFKLFQIVSNCFKACDRNFLYFMERHTSHIVNLQRNFRFLTFLGDCVSKALWRQFPKYFEMKRRVAVLLNMVYAGGILMIAMMKRKSNTKEKFHGLTKNS